MNLDHMGVTAIHHGWTEFVKANPGLRGCELISRQEIYGDITFAVRLHGHTHVHVFSPMDGQRGPKLMKFLEGLAAIGRNEAVSVSDAPPSVLKRPTIKPVGIRKFYEESNAA